MAVDGIFLPLYVHAKTTIVDDMWLILGSANLNNRGMRDDTEMNVTIVHPEMARRLRILLMAEHLGLCDEDTLFRILETLGRVHLPEGYEKYEVKVHAVNGWLAILSTPQAESASTPESTFAQKMSLIGSRRSRASTRLTNNAPVRIR
jgi:phosphatidylserine/phosphatidylglycerophosphate/cardiolipin synthase-like enzyme